MKTLQANDRLVKEEERFYLTNVSRSQAWKLEQKGQYPKRVRLSARSIAWKLSELNAWVDSRS